MNFRATLQSLIIRLSTRFHRKGSLLGAYTILGRASAFEKPALKASLVSMVHPSRKFNFSFLHRNLMLSQSFDRPHLSITRSNANRSAMGGHLWKILSPDIRKTSCATISDSGGLGF